MPSEMRILEVGDPAPDLSALGIGVGAEGADSDGLEMGDEPTVMAFRFRARQCEGERESLRAELRGLGATLLVLSPEDWWCFRPDDETQALSRVPEVAASTLRTAFAAYGVPREGGAGELR
ncbi:MAG TPA: hypothetical protein VGP07_12795, partial [Polyangia bacterium]